MRVLLDTQAFLWIAGDWRRVRPSAQRVFEDLETELYLSVASVWEIAIKSGLGRLSLPTAPTVYVPRRIADFGISVLDIRMDHALSVYSLPMYHADPFDRIIIAQAQLEELTVATSDGIFRQYNVDLLPI